MINTFRYEDTLLSLDLSDKDCYDYKSTLVYITIVDEVKAKKEVIEQEQKEKIVKLKEE